MTSGLLLLIAFLALAVGIGTAVQRPAIWLALTVTGVGSSLMAALRVLPGGDNWEWRSAFLLGGEPLHLRLDGLSAWFLMLVSVVGGAGAVYSREYWSDENNPASAPRGRAWWNAFLVSMGLVPILFWPALSCVVTAWHPAWLAVEPPAPLVTLGSAQIALASLVLLAAVWLWQKAHDNGLRQRLTWDCGYSLPTARMQYTSASFAGIGIGWFRWVLQPVRKAHCPRGHFPAAALHLERIPETVLERLLGPVSLVILQAAAGARRLQHGRLQFYILYVVVGLIGVGILVLLEGAQ
jgi:hypothetical protein